MGYIKWVTFNRMRRNIDFDVMSKMSVAAILTTAIYK